MIVHSPVPGPMDPFRRIDEGLRDMAPVTKKAAREMGKVQEATVRIEANLSGFHEAVRRARLALARLDFAMEAGRLAEHQVDARWYVRGALDPAYATPEARDAYLRVILTSAARHRLTAASAFLRGWAEHRPVDGAPVQNFVAHRYFGLRAGGVEWKATA